MDWARSTKRTWAEPNQSITSSSRARGGCPANFPLFRQRTEIKSRLAAMEYSADQEREMQEHHHRGHRRSAGTGAPDGSPSSATCNPIRTACGMVRSLMPSFFSRGPPLPLPPSPPARVHQVWPGRNVSMLVSVCRAAIYLCYLSLHWELKLRDHGGTVQSGVCNCSQCFFFRQNGKCSVHIHNGIVCSFNLTCI